MQLQEGGLDVRRPGPWDLSAALDTRIIREPHVGTSSSSSRGGLGKRPVHDGRMSRGSKRGRKEKAGGGK